MKKNILALPTLILVATLATSATVSAESVSGQVNLTTNAAAINGKVDMNVKRNDDNKRKADDIRNNAIFGTVTAINGTTLTVSSKSMDKNASAQATTTYTVNASGAIVDKDRTPSNLASIAVGNNVMIEGKVDGTNVIATKIHNGAMAKGGVKVALPEGNGQPIVGGTVTAVNGNTVTITNKSNVSYTIDASNAKITKAGTTATVSNIAVGDSLVAQGTINGTSVTAVNIVDSGTVQVNTKAKVGFFGKIGGFFARIFGFGK